MDNLLDTIYDPDQFKKFGYELIDMITDYLKNTAQDQVPVHCWKMPSEQFDFWKNYSLNTKDPIPLFKAIMDRSMHVHHPKYIGHQISPTAPLAALSGLISAILNNGMAVYEMGPAATAIEKVIVEMVSKKVGYDHNSDGFLTSGGTLANVTALLAARQAMTHLDIWENGHHESLGVLVSSQAHYCIDRAIRIMGFGAKGMVKVPLNATHSMDTTLLETYYQKAKEEGIKIIAVVGNAPSTATGMYDDLEAISRFCSAKKLWFHVDGAHGGAVVYSKKYAPLAKGIAAADSVVIDGHKMLMMPSIMTFLLFKNRQQSYIAFKQKAHYLWDKSDDDQWYNMAKRTFECTKHMMSIKFYTVLKMYGAQAFDSFVTHLYDLAQLFAQKVYLKTHFELACNPQSNIVCFRYSIPELSEDELNHLNGEIRNELLQQGVFYIVQTLLDTTLFLRVTFMNTKTTPEMMEELLTIIEKKAVYKTRPKQESDHYDL